MLSLRKEGRKGMEEAPKYQTAYACEGKKLTIECDPGDLINLIRANYGRFSITICNDHGNVEWSVNCMFPKSLTVLNSRCAHKQSCSVLATTSMFGDPCPGTHKYLEAHYQCISAAQTSTTTNRPSPPPWVLSNGPPIFANGSTIINPGAAPPQQSSGAAASPPRLPTLPGVVGISAQGGLFNAAPSSHTSSPVPPTLQPTLPGGRLKGNYNNTIVKNNNNNNRHDGLPPPPQLPNHHGGGGGGGHKDEATVHHKGSSSEQPTRSSKAPGGSNATAPSNTRILTGVGGMGSDDGTLLTTKSSSNRQSTPYGGGGGGGGGSTATMVQPTAPSGGNNFSGGGGIAAGGGIRTINNINLNAGLAGTDDETKLFCGPTNARNLFWNMTRVGDVNVQPCPGGAAGIAKWRCVLMKRLNDLDDLVDDFTTTTTSTTQRPQTNGGDCVQNSSNCEPPMTLAAHKVNQRLRNFEPTWHPMTPDLTQCRSLWLNNLEMRVNQRDSSLTSIANDLSEVTSSKMLYGGDMLVTTKIIQTMSEKMFHDKETYPDQHQREVIIMELLHGVVKTGSNLLDEAQLSSWLDLNQEDQMRVATSLLTGLEYNAFLLADTIIRERNVVQKVKNILLSVRVLETKNIQGNEVFPDVEGWPLSDDRIELPRAALLENSEGGLVRIVFAAFDRLESILKPSYDHFDLKSARSYIRNTAILSNDSDINAELQQRIRILNSKVISASLGKGRHIQLSQPIKLVLKHLKTENVTNPTCVFWNYIDHAWSANGCALESTNRTHSTCMCNHLTNFALLMDVVDEHQHSLFTMFDGNMRIFIYISVAICLVFIVIALLTLKIFSGVFVKSARTSIYRSIYICLLAIELLFLLGIEQTETSKICGFITVFLHCAILSGIAWFCYEAFHSYTTITTDDILLEVDQTAKVNCYYLLSYGMSLTVVAISLVINPSTYTQNDFCVLMETNVLFYVTFVLPVLIFFGGALVYTFLSWMIMCRKSRTTLKTKEHARLSNVRFDIRCSFVFLLLLSAVWGTAYFYLRGAKLDEEVAIVYGYCFVSFNTLMGLYIFVFHCIQNEKIRREYRKYVRQHAWLPKCLRCSKTSISSGIVGGSGAGNAGTINSNSASPAGAQLKKSKLPTEDGSDDANDNDNDACIGATEDAIMATSDCELNEGQTQQRRNPVMKSGIMSGNLVLPHQGGHIVLERGGGGGLAAQPPHTGTLRSTGGLRTPSAGHTSPTSSAGSTHLIFGHKQQQQQQQPSASNMNVAAGQQEVLYHQPDYYAWKQPPTPGAGVANKSGRGDYYNNPTSPQQAHEVFYWTQKHNQQNKKKRSSGMGPDSPNGSLHSRTTAASQVLFYPSYKKTPAMKNQAPPGQQQQYPHYAEALDPPNAATYYQQQQHQQTPHHQRHNQRQLHQQQQQQQLSSDEEQMASEAHAHLLHIQQRRAGGQQQLPPPPPHMAQYHHDFIASAAGAGGNNGGGGQRYYRNKHSNCDLNQDFDAAPIASRGGAGGSDAYYNQGSLAGDNGPVYEEILSNRNSSDVQHYEVGDFDVDEVYNNSVGAFNAARVARAGFGTPAVVPQPTTGGNISGGGSVSSRNKIRQTVLPPAAAAAAALAAQQQQQLAARRRQQNINNPNDDDDDDEVEDDEDDDDEHEESVCDDDESELDEDDSHGLPPQSDERMRRLMALQDKDFQRRFQRQLRKNGAPIDYNQPPVQLVAHHHQQHPQQQQQLPPHHSDNAVFGVSGGVGEGSVRSYKMHAKSPNGRLAVNELFNHHPHSAAASAVAGGSVGGVTVVGPPLPPANQKTAHRQQQMLQKISPQSTTTTTTSSSSHSLQQQQPTQIHPQQQQQQPFKHQLQQQQPRNISAMLDENNTVRCYLEPLAK